MAEYGLSRIKKMFSQSKNEFKKPILILMYSVTIFITVEIYKRPAVVVHILLPLSCHGRDSSVVT